MLYVGLAAGLSVVVASLVSLLFVRRSRRRADSIGRYSRAVSALRTIAAEPRPELKLCDRPSSPLAADVRVLDGSPGAAPRARRREPRWRAARLDPDLLAQRPVIARLPSISAPITAPPAAS